MAKGTWADGKGVNYAMELGNEHFPEGATRILIHRTFGKEEVGVKLIDIRTDGQKRRIFFDTKLCHPTDDELVALANNLKEVWTYALYYEGSPKEQYRPLTNELEAFFHAVPQP